MILTTPSTARRMVHPIGPRAGLPKNGSRSAGAPLSARSGPAKSNLVHALGLNACHRGLRTLYVHLPPALLPQCRNALRVPMSAAGAHVQPRTAGDRRLRSRHPQRAQETTFARSDRRAPRYSGSSTTPTASTRYQGINATDHGRLKHGGQSDRYLTHSRRCTALRCFPPSPECTLQTH